MIWPFRRRTVEQTFHDVPPATIGLLTGRTMTFPGINDHDIPDDTPLTVLEEHVQQIVRIHAKQLDDACRIAQELGVGVAVIRDTTHGTQHAAPNRWIPAGHLYQFPDTQSYLTFCKEQP